MKRNSLLEPDRGAEYCQQLQKHIRIGKPFTSNQPRYIDTVEFWKDQYSKIHSEKRALEDEIQHLKQFQFLSRHENSNDASEFNESEIYARRLLSSTFTLDLYSSKPSKQPLPNPQELSLRENQDDEEVFFNSKFLKLYTSGKVFIQSKNAYIF